MNRITVTTVISGTLFATVGRGVVCHCESHIMVDECAAPEFYSGRAKLVGVDGEEGKMTPQTIEMPSITPGPDAGRRAKARSRMTR